MSKHTAFSGLHILGISLLLLTGHLGSVSAFTCYNGKGEVLSDTVRCQTSWGDSICCKKTMSTDTVADVCGVQTNNCKYGTGKGTPDDFATIGCTDKSWSVFGCRAICGDFGKEAVVCDDGSACCQKVGPGAETCCKSNGSGGSDKGGKDTQSPAPAPTNSGSTPGSTSSTGNQPNPPEKTEAPASGQTSTSNTAGTATSTDPLFGGAIPTTGSTTTSTIGDSTETQSDSGSPSQSSGDSEVTKARKTVTTVIIAVAVGGSVIGLISCIGVGCCLWRCLRRRRRTKPAQSNWATGPAAYGGRVELEDAPVPYASSATQNTHLMNNMTSQGQSSPMQSTTPWGYHGNQTSQELANTGVARPTELDAARSQAEIDSTQRAVSPASMLQYHDGKSAYIRTPSPQRQNFDPPAYTVAPGQPNTPNSNEAGQETRRRTSGLPVFHEMG